MLYISEIYLKLSLCAQLSLTRNVASHQFVPKLCVLKCVIPVGLNTTMCMPDAFSWLVSSQHYYGIAVIL